MPAIRNVAIIAHVDHGKTTLVDRMLYQSGQFRDEELDKLAGGQHGLIMDSNDLERERGITIFSKNCAIQYVRNEGQRWESKGHSPGGKSHGPRATGQGSGNSAVSESLGPRASATAVAPAEYKINIIDTPGHADFGGEVERVLRMADGVLLLVDAFEGPMPQTRFVLAKALANGLRPIVVINKADRPDARPDDVVNEVFDLLVELEADDKALDFPVIFASAKQGWAVTDLTHPREDLRPIFDAIIDRVPEPAVDPDEPLRILVTSLIYSDYVGRIAVGRVFGGRINEGQQVAVIDREEHLTDQRVLEVHLFDGLARKRAPFAEAGDIVALVGLDEVDIGESVCDPDDPRPVPPVKIDEPTLHMTFRVNDSPFAGREGDFVTSRQVKDRLAKELQSNVALKVTPGATPEEFHVSGRGLMHLGILLENMRREGYELAAGKPKVIFREIDGKRHEPIERLVVDCPADCQGAVMSLTGDRRAELLKMDAKAGATGFVHMEFSIPARGLIGLRARMLTATQGRAIMHHTFERYELMRGPIPHRLNGVMVAMETGQVTAYALDKLYDRGFFFVKPGDQVYDGQIIGEHNRDNDITVNVCTTKKLSNMRASGKDEAAQIRPAREMSLEQCLEYIQDDELVEITPTGVRMRKRMLKEADRRRESRKVRA